MKLPICVFDAKTGMLCKTCKANLERGSINTLDVDISKVLAKNQKNLQKAKFISAIDTATLIIMIGNSKLIDLLEKNKRIVEEIERTLPKAVEFVALKENLKDTLAALFSPIEVAGIDKIYVPDGTTELGRFNRKLTLFDKYVLDMTSDGARTLDRRIAVALGVLLDTGERR